MAIRSGVGERRDVGEVGSQRTSGAVWRAAAVGFAYGDGEGVELVEKAGVGGGGVGGEGLTGEGGEGRVSGTAAGRGR